MTVNSDLIYDVLRRHEPDYVAARDPAEAASGLTDISRIALARARGRIRHRVLDCVSPRGAGADRGPGRECGGAARRTRCWKWRAPGDGSHRRNNIEALIDVNEALPARDSPALPSEEPPMIAAPLHIVNERLMLCPTGVLLWPARWADGGGGPASGESASYLRALPACCRPRHAGDAAKARLRPAPLRPPAPVPLGAASTTPRAIPAWWQRPAPRRRTSMGWK